MKFGVVLGICTDRDADQRRAINSIARFTRKDTEMFAVFNGVKPFEVDPRYKITHYENLLGREQGLWPLALQIAGEHQWDFVFAPHDDFYLLESGWERWIERAYRTYKIGIASYACWGYADGHATNPDPKNPNYTVETGNPPTTGPVDSPLGVAIDGCGVAFNTRLFTQRGWITPIQAMC